MDVVNLIVMGKTGAGKSTLINAVLAENLAPTGSGQAVTKENRMYSKKMLIPGKVRASENSSRISVSKIVRLYDTVGLEIDTTVTQRTLAEIGVLIQKAQDCEGDRDITLVWFCVNCRSSRFEDYEIELIRSMSVEKEIPFLLVLTQCYSNEESELEMQIRNEFPEIPIARVLAKDYALRSGTVSAYGVQELLQQSVSDYDRCKVRILEDKLQQLNSSRENVLNGIRVSGDNCIKSYSRKVQKIGWVPGGCIPFVHGLCIAMIAELNRVAKINSSKQFADQIFANAVVAVISTPFMAIPVLSAVVATAYIESVGETYLDSLISVISVSTNKELQNADLMAARIKAEIEKRKK